MSIPWFSPPPPLPDARWTACAIEPRYEDVAQDGRALLEALPHTLGEVAWRPLLTQQAEHRALLQHGIVPILTRLVIDAGDEPVPVTRALEARGAFDLAHATDDAGAVERLLLDLWAEVHGARGRTHQPAGEGDGARVLVGRVFAEHVFTRPWGPPEHRKVTRFDVEGLAPVPARRRAFRPLHACAALPPDATWIDSSATLDPCPIVFGLLHTDSNQHVNSLVYPRLFAEAALRRLAERERPRRVLVRALDIAYRKPSFAGERVRIHTRLFAHGL